MIDITDTTTPPPLAPLKGVDGAWESHEQKFAAEVHLLLDDIGATLIAKNAAYGSSALDPVRVFSRAPVEEQLLVRLDDKLSRLARGHEFAGDDTLRDIIGYLCLLLIARNSD